MTMPLDASKQNDVCLTEHRRALYPALCLKNAEASLNFGATPFAFSPPRGYVGLAAAPPSSIVSGTYNESVDAQRLEFTLHSTFPQHLCLMPPRIHCKACSGCVFCMAGRRLSVFSCVSFPRHS